jgi:hypothetical protein
MTGGKRWTANRRATDMESVEYQIDYRIKKYSLRDGEYKTVRTIKVYVYKCPESGGEVLTTSAVQAIEEAYAKEKHLLQEESN